jgi:hypothetical protein
MIRKAHRFPRFGGTVAPSVPSTPPPDPGSYALLRKSALQYDSSTFLNSQRLLAVQQQLARFDLVVTGMGMHSNLTRRIEAVAGIHSAAAALGKTCPVYNYNIISEVVSSPSSWMVGTPLPEGGTVYTKMQANPSWWMRNAAGQRMTWTHQYEGVDCNIGLHTTPDSMGRRLPQWRADIWLQFHETVGFDGIWMDNMLPSPLLYWETGGDYSDTWAHDWGGVGYAPGDWNLTGVNAAHTSETARASVAAGFGAHFDRILDTLPNMKFMGNCQSSNLTWLNRAQFVGRVWGGFYEGMVGKSYSISNATTVLQRLHALSEHLTTAENHTTAGIWLPTWNSFDLFLYGVCLAHMDEATPTVHSDDNGGHAGVPIWYDEYDLPIGLAVDPHVTAPIATTVYKRQYQNALILANGDASTTRTYTPPSGIYKYPTGLQNPSLNNGATITGAVTLPPRSGRILMCVTPGVHS